MPDEETLERIRGLEMFQGLPPEKLAELARLLDPVHAPAGQVIVEEGTVGDCMFILMDGAVRIEKKIPSEDAPKMKELATLTSGDFFGEMALVEDQVRSARVVAATDADLYRLDRDDLFAWLESQPQSTAAFFKMLVRTLSRRLRATSRELTMLYDLATLFLEPHPSERALANEVVQNMVHYFEGSWTVAGYLYNEFNDEFELADAAGAEAELVKSLPPPPAGEAPGWRDAKNLLVALPGKAKPAGFLLLVANKPQGSREQEEVARVAQTVGRLLVSAMLNIRHTAEEALKVRLKTTTY